MPRERLAPERRVVLQQVVDVPHPVVLLARPRALDALAPVRRLADRRPVDARDRVQRRAHRHALARGEHVRRLAVHRQPGGGPRALTQLEEEGGVGNSRGGKCQKTYPKCDGRRGREDERSER